MQDPLSIDTLPESTNSNSTGTMGASLRRRQRSRSGGASEHDDSELHPAAASGAAAVAEHRRRHGSQQQHRKCRLASASSNGVKRGQRQSEVEDEGEEEDEATPKPSSRKNPRVNVKKLKEDEISHYSGTDRDEVAEDETDDDENDDDEASGDEEAVIPPPRSQRGAALRKTRGGAGARRSTRTKAETASSRRHRRSSREVKTEQQERPRRGPKSELAKLLEAGASSFHCESAKEATSRMASNGLGPIHVEVCQTALRGSFKTSLTKTYDISVFQVSDHSNSSYDAFVQAKVSTRKRQMRQQQQEEEDEDSPPRRGTRRAASGKSTSRNSSASNNNNNNNNRSTKKIAQKKKRKGFRGFRRPILTKEDLLEGPVLIPPKEELLAAARSAAERGRKGKKGKRGGGPRPTRRPSYSQYLPKERFDELDRRLAELDEEPLDVDCMEFSFERRPLHEAWFQTYSRQDQGDEMLFYPEGKGYPLPYEMPMTTFYPNKSGVKKRSQLLGGQEGGDSSSFYPSAVPSGTATPEESLPGNRGNGGSKRKVPPVPDLALPASKILRRSAAVKATAAVTGGGSTRKDSKASSTDSDCSYVRKKHLARLMGGSAAARALQPHERKSPRCHASTKALLNAPTTTADEEEEEDVVVDDVEEESGDQQQQKKPSRKRDVTENPVHLVKLAGSLDSFLREEDPSLVTDMEEEPDAPRVLLQKRKKRRGSSGRQGSVGSGVGKVSIPVEDPMDRLVASNVDPVLLDLLEEECPSVALDDEVPGSQPMELLSTYESCDSISKCSRRMFRLMEGGGGDRQKRAADEVEQPPDVEEKKGGTAVSRLKVASAIQSRRDSSSEYATSICSVSSSSSAAVRGKRRRKRNLTGFPRPKKKKSRPKSLLNDVLTREAEKNAKEVEEEEEEEEEELEGGEDSDSDELDSDDENVTYKVATPPPRKRPLKKSCSYSKVKTASQARRKGGGAVARRRNGKKVSYKEPSTDIEDEDEDEEEEVSDSDESEENSDSSDEEAGDEASSDEEDEDEDDEDDEDEDDSEEDSEEEDEDEDDEESESVDEEESEPEEEEEESSPKSARKLPSAPKRGGGPAGRKLPPASRKTPRAAPPKQHFSVFSTPSRVSRRMGRKTAIAAAAARRRR